jgi:hypothetical protein
MSEERKERRFYIWLAGEGKEIDDPLLCAHGVKQAWDLKELVDDGKRPGARDMLFGGAKLGWPVIYRILISSSWPSSSKYYLSWFMVFHIRFKLFATHWHFRTPCYIDEVCFCLMKLQT